MTLCCNHLRFFSILYIWILGQFSDIFYGMDIFPLIICDQKHKSNLLVHNSSFALGLSVCNLSPISCFSLLLLLDELLRLKIAWEPTTHIQHHIISKQHGDLPSKTIIYHVREQTKCQQSIQHRSHHIGNVIGACLFLYLFSGLLQVLSMLQRSVIPRPFLGQQNRLLSVK